MSSCVSPFLNAASPELLMPWFSGGLGTLDCNAMKARMSKNPVECSTAIHSTCESFGHSSKVS